MTAQPASSKKYRIWIGVGVLLAVVASATAIWRGGLAWSPTPHARRTAALRAAQAAGDENEEARINAELAQEGFRAARACVLAWRELRDEETGLFPRGGEEEDQALLWSGQDTGADLMPHMLYAAIRVAPEEEPTWRAALATERRWAEGGLPRTIRLRPATVVELSEEMLLQNGAEYAADGLVPLVERLGEGPWLDRLREVTDAVIARAAIVTGRGPIPSTRAETNGNLLQVVARLQPSTQNPRHLEMAERIATWYAVDLLPRSGNLPPRGWDLGKDKRDRKYVKLRDHGGEVIPGLAELYLYERGEARDFAATMQQPLAAMLRALAGAERTSEGLWLDSIVPETGKVLHNRERTLVDTWGYVANAFVMTDLADARSAFTTGEDGPNGPEVERVMRSVARAHGMPWEPETPHDGYADAIESMLALLPFHPVEGAAEWVDDEIERLLAMQRGDGFIAREYLDGNFVRTAMLYAEWKTRGARLEPWRDDLLIGAADDGGSGAALRLHLAAGATWSGRLRLDPVRHRTNWNMKIEYPRRNGSPEWFTVESTRRYAVRDLDTGATVELDGAALIEGVPVSLEPGRAQRLVVEAL